MIADQNFYGICFMFFNPTASATAYGRRPKFVRAEHSATAEGENCAYGPTLSFRNSSISFQKYISTFFANWGIQMTRILTKSAIKDVDFKAFDMHQI